jgi:amino acid permease
MIALISILGLTVFVAATVGYLGYLAFGNSVKGVILYSLPNDDPAAITAKICYVLTIMGSFVLLIQPIFYIIESSNWYRATSSCCADDGPEEMMDPDEKKDDKMGDKEGSMMMEDPAAMNEGGAGESQMDNDENKDMSGDESVLLDGRKPSFCGYVVYFSFRTLVVVIVCFFAFLIPNISILITFGGAVLGTIVNILLPVLFYNRAYNGSAKNRALEKPAEDMMAADMMNNGGGDMDEMQESMMAEGGGEDMGQAEEKDDNDPRACIKITSWIVLFFGLVVGIWGLVYVIMELSSGDAKEDSAD